MATYEVPLSSTPQSFTIQLADVSYQLTLKYADAPEGSWILDIADASGNNILYGAPLVTGHDILGQYEYLQIGGQLIVQTDGDPDAPPTFANLGTAGRLYFVTA